MTNKLEAIRKTAILISALDMDAADALLDQMPPEFSDAVRACVMQLDTIDSDEQFEVIDSFLSGSQTATDVEVPSAPPKEETPIALEEFLTQRRSPALPVEEETVSNQSAYSDLRTDESADAQATTPFQFFASASEDQIAQALRHEHPQAVAVVLGHIPAEQAASLLARLPERMQVQVARRMVDMEDVDAETLQEIERGLQSLIGVRPAGGASQVGLAAMQRIVASSSGQATSLLHKLRCVDAELAQQLAPPESAESISPASQEACSRTISNVAATVQFEFDDLGRLNHPCLGRVLQKAPGRVLLLALAGASPAFIEKVYRQLPRKDAETLRRQIEQQGTILLRDVEAAQQHIAQIAGRLAASGMIEPPPSKRFAFAA